MQPILSLLQTKERVVAAIDGRSAAGKSTLADALAAELDGAVIRMDHFFLPAALRGPNRPHMDTERFEREAAAFIRSGRAFTYRVFDCGRQELAETVIVPQKRLWIVEGAYCLLPQFESLYDYRIFADIDPREQKNRIALRGGDAAAEAFRDRWIPAEEAYFEEYRIREKCDYIYRSAESEE